MAGSIFIDDGYTMEGRWPAAADGRYVGGTFKYRCALAEVRDKYAAAAPSQRAAVRAEILSKHVESITPNDPDAGEDGPKSFKPSASEWKTMRPDVAGTILDHVLDYVGPEKAEKN